MNHGTMFDSERKEATIKPVENCKFAFFQKSFSNARVAHSKFVPQWQAFQAFYSEFWKDFATVCGRRCLIYGNFVTFFFFPPWQQSSCSQRTCLCPIFGPNITWPLCPIEFFFISLKEKSHKKKTFCRCCWGEEKNDRGAVGHHRRWILKILINGIKVWTEYQWQRKVLWREWKIFVLGIPLYTFPS